MALSSRTLPTLLALLTSTPTLLTGLPSALADVPPPPAPPASSAPPAPPTSSAPPAPPTSSAQSAPPTSSAQSASPGVSPGVPAQPASAARTSQSPPPPGQAAAPPGSPPGTGPGPNPDPAAYTAYYEPSEGSERTWYGWQTLIVMGASSAFFVVPFATGDTLLVGVPVMSFVFGGPIVHFAHGRIGRGFGVLGMHFGIATGSALLGAGLACAGGRCGSGEFSGVAAFLGAAAGASLGLLASNIIDVAALAYTDPQEERKKVREQAFQLSIVPQLSISPDHSFIGLAGTF
ncbi:hypothetical protein [Chondromyces apiculatus]|uniref:Uncharacterized protein n=1 Tax=Chondromyces apiculatus DSM 436 TaxID=1192034 RepID=A0A017T8D7_9BACT|nr:hypothetical protein [Chondromyces apiculatus]EYF05242.1 Hypothetical protein CAP_3382 [Chondromyces apiculatus DSM 436]